MNPKYPANQNLVELWLSLLTAKPKARANAAIEILNAQLGTLYTHSHLSRWRRGIQQPSNQVQSIMREAVVQQALSQALGLPEDKFSKPQLKHLLRLLEPPQPQ